MFNQKYVEMTKHGSAIRAMFMYGLERAKVVGPENVFDFSLGNPSVPAPECVNDAIREILDTMDSVAVHGYSPANGIDAARLAIVEDLNARFGTNYGINNIFMAVSAAGAIAHALRAVIMEEGDEIVTFVPYFPEYMEYVSGAGGKFVAVPADTDTLQINFEAFEAVLNPNVRAVLINTPNNPSGIVYSKETIERLAAILEEKQKEYGHSIYIISDEPYRELVFSGVEAPFVAKYYANTMICYSYSKSMSIPGERIGYVVINTEAEDYPHAVAVFAQISRGIGHNCPPSLMQLALAKCAGAVSDLSVYETNKNILMKELTRMGFDIIEPGGTFYMFPRALEPDAKAFCEKAKEFDLLLVPSDSFGCEGFFRIAYCCTTEKILRALPKFEALAEYYKNKQQA